MRKRVALYVRVSTSGQAVENQRLELLAAAQRNGWDVVATFEDCGVSGTKGREHRPGFDELCRAIGRRDVELVAAWSVDRLGRSLQDLVAFLNELRAKGVDLFLHQQGLDTSTPAGKAMFQMLGVFAEFERAMIVERVRAGLSRARAGGRILGRPKVSSMIEDRVRSLLAAGTGIRRTAAELRVGVSVVQRVRSEVLQPRPGASQ